MVSRIIVIFIFLSLLSCTGRREKTADDYLNNYVVFDFGATGDGVKKDTEAINKAINLCSEHGGGSVYFPPGKYLTGAIHLKDNVGLYLEKGSEIIFSSDFNDYPTVQTRFEGVECHGYSPLIYGRDLVNISIRGEGIIDANGKAWWNRQNTIMSKPKNEILPESEREKEFAELNKNCDPGDLIGSHKWYWSSQFIRPSCIQFYNCENVVIEGITIVNSPFWTVHPVYCKNVHINSIIIKNPKDSPNTDGINPDSSEDVYISNCHIDVGDDCITLKSGRDVEGRNIARSCQNITIMNCIMIHGHGGIVIGSEMSGGIRNIVVSNCIFRGTERGIRVKTQRGRGGIVENFCVSNIIMENVRTPFVLNMQYTDIPQESFSERTPTLRDFCFSNIIAKGAEAAGEFIGLEENPIKNVSLIDCYIQAEKGITGSFLESCIFKNIKLDIKEGKDYDIRLSNQVLINN